MRLYTIGTSNKSAEDFFSILSKAGIDKLIDIRINNKSQLLGFSKGKDLRYFCEKCHNIKYEHVAELAPTKELIKQYQKSKDWASYEKEFRDILKSRPIVDIFKKACGEDKAVCLLCSEQRPQKCHRRLVAEYLKNNIKDFKIIHL